jgi:putative hemolysin
VDKYTDIEALTQYITDEVFRIFKQSPESWIRRNLGPALHLPAHRFATLAANFDADILEYGFREATIRIISKYILGFEARNTDKIPQEGPLLITSNHPGTIDSLVITASVPRPDLKIIATGIPFIESLRNAADHLIYTPRLGIHERMQVVRSAIHHLREGGAVLIFPSGRIDPDPDLSPKEAADFGRWSHSVELMLKQVPQTQVLVTIVSGVLSAKWRWNPLVRLMGDDLKQRSVAEVFQIIQSIILPKLNRVEPRLTFSDPLTTDQLAQTNQDLLDSMIEHARCLMEDHLAEGKKLLPANT